jgi:hypothetical protein
MIALQPTFLLVSFLILAPSAFSFTHSSRGGCQPTCITTRELPMTVRLASLAEALIFHLKYFYLP